MWCPLPNLKKRSPPFRNLKSLSKKKGKRSNSRQRPLRFFLRLCTAESRIRHSDSGRGSDVNTRSTSIIQFEKTGEFDPVNNYAFGEGGAGTFSDGKLTSRTKRIAKEKQFVLESYVKAGAPEEILHMSHPHLGSDNLAVIVRRLRDEYLSLGGRLPLPKKFHPWM